MKLDDKRKVIGVLLCAGDPGELETIAYMCLGSSLLHQVFDIAHEARKQVARERCDDAGMPVSEGTYEDDCLEAAYRLIESSPTLIREWFRRPK